MRHEKTVEQTYAILDELEHVRKRPGLWIGSVLHGDHETYTIDQGKFVKKTMNVIPAFLKIFDEILSNSCDEAKRAPDVLDTIKVSINKLTGEFVIEDNGRGIPVTKHAETGMYVPEMIFTNLRAGSNFSDNEDQSLVGTNGVGSTICAILSEYFIVETADGKKSFRQEYRNGLREKSDNVIGNSTRKYTRITFCPDYAYFKMDGLDDDHIKTITKMVYDAAANNTGVNFFINGVPIKIDTFQDYVSMYNQENVYEESPTWKIAVAHNDGFEHISFVNGVNTYQGGTHVDYISNQVVSKIREHIQKKNKIDVKPSDIKNHIRVFISANINRPRFSSQTKENMVSPISEWKSSHEVSDKFIKKVIGSSIIQSILDWATAKQQANELAELRKLNKGGNDKLSLKKIPKFHDATTKNRSDAVLFLAEGDSALSPLLGARNPQTMGLFPLKGRPINVSATTMAKIKDNDEFDRIRTIIGLKYGVTADPSKLNFGKIVVASDADEFGKSICGLIINMFYRLWPELIEHGMLYRLVTPMVVAGAKSSEKEFFSLEDFEKWRNDNEGKKVSYRFLKGLGSNDSKRFKKYLDNPDKYMEQFILAGQDDKNLLDLCFLKEKGFTDQRKKWLDIE